MTTYKNISFSAKTFYGVKFEPGEVKSVPGYINCDGMVRVFGIKPISGTAKSINPTMQTTPVTRGRKKKSVEPENTSNAETETTIIETPKEETSDGNPS